MPISAASSPSLSLCISSSSSTFLSSPLHFPKSLSCPRKPLLRTQTLIRSALSTLPVLSFSGDKVGEAYLDLKSAPPETARSVVHRGIVADQQNKRRGTASTLTRGEVRGGGRKPYPQKKTGGARRGSQRTPLRPGGGIIFGPKPRDWSVKINRKEKRLAISTAIASASGSAVVVEDFGFERPRTADFVAALGRWGIDPRGEKAVFVMTEVAENVRLSSRNIGTVKVLTPRTLNLFDVLNSDRIVITKSALDYLNSTYGSQSGDEEESEEGNEEGSGDEASEAAAE
ncbi:hypothetical protein QJS04_geneDACA007583 [Acorus gramineus]|uniref:Large ribosomal subunit protein uL4c n=1 Tax=Acorus gramineus TaxID=55184 RepID=A0AAV9B167_ACOGR|nr:hypothetical protein QJS04_geneDACA007583 [Acorus gramineus]